MEWLKWKVLAFVKNSRGLPGHIIKTVSKSSFMLSFSEATVRLLAWWSTDLVISIQFSLVYSFWSILILLLAEGSGIWWDIFSQNERSCTQCKSKEESLSLETVQLNWGSQRWEALWWLTERQRFLQGAAVFIWTSPSRQIFQAQRSNRISSEWSRRLYLGFISELLNVPEKVSSERQTCFLFMSWYTRSASGL